MKAFMDKDFLLTTDTAKHLYHDYAAKQPLADYHCHLNPQEIYEDRRFNNLVEVWLGGVENSVLAGDHYKWRLLRSNGVSEEYVTGNAPAYERFLKFAEALELSIGNPMYHWCHMELQRYFGVTEPLTVESAPRIWEHCNKLLQEDPDFTARGLIRKSNVAMIGTTDDPIDSLEWHEKIAADDSFDVLVCPSFRPDKAMNAHQKGFAEYIEKLAKCVGKTTLSSAQEVCDALVERLEFFQSLGCRASDHGFTDVPFRPIPMEEANRIFRKAMVGEALTQDEIDGYQTTIILHLSKAYHRLNIVMQIHFSALRNTNQRMMQTLGADAGYDAMAKTNCIENIFKLLSALDNDGTCPKTILYSLNPADNAQMGTLLACFQSSEMPGKIQQGSAWWFNDNKVGMIEQMTSLANLGILGNFVGMLTDSRSFLSYARHEYFRRILCELIGTWVENGEYPNNDTALKRIVEGISYQNAKRYFNI